MFEHKLKALGYLEYDKIDGNDPEHVRKLVVWLEDQKIGCYTIEDRYDLRDIKSPKWPETFNKYCKDVKCPITTNVLDQLEWLIGHAIRIEYTFLRNKYHVITGCKDITSDFKRVNVLAKCRIDALDMSSQEFINWVNAIAKLLKIAQHSDYFATLEACQKLINARLNKTALQHPETVIVKGTPFPVLETKCGFSLGDTALDNAAKILTMLHIQDLRKLQTTINELIVKAQNYTACPKTDNKLGKVGI